MTDWILFVGYLSLYTGIIYSPYGVIVLTKMIAQVDSGTLTYWLVKHLRHGGIINLVHYHIEYQSIRQCINLKLIAPDTVLGHAINVFVNSLMIFNERNIHFLVIPDILPAFNSHIHVIAFISMELISNRPEKTITVSSHLHDLQTVWSKLLFELLHVCIVEFLV